MTVTELIALFRTEAFDRASPPLFADSEITLWLNEAEIEAAIRQELFRENISIHLTQFDIRAGVREYPLDPRMFEISYASLIYKNATGMLPFPMGITTAAEMDSYRPFWRSLPFRPMAIIQYDSRIEMDCLPNAEYTIRVEGYRLPMATMGFGSVFTASIASTTMTVTYIASGSLVAGQVLTGVAGGTTIVAQLSGNVAGGLGTYQVSVSQNVVSQSISCTGAVAEVLSTGTLTLTGGASGSVNTVLVNGLDILGSAVPFNTSLTQTAADVVTQIGLNSQRYTASSLGAAITLTDLQYTGSLHNGYTVSAGTTTITTSSTAFTGGIDAVVTTPEINRIHHRHLIKWALHRAYQRPDAETMDAGKSKRALDEFEDYFGARPDCSLWKKSNASNPHRNMSYA